MNLLDQIKMGFYKSEGLFRLMLINIAVFLVIGLVKVILFLAGSGNYWLLEVIDKLAAHSSLTLMLHQPWSFISYMFVHENFTHILFNMLVLYWMGKIFCEYLGSKKVVVVYILGALTGVVAYIASYNIFPAFADVVQQSSLIGASAGVIAVLVAIATLIPDYQLQLLLFGAVRLKFIALFLVLLYIISIPEGNAGGNISHLGGALFGFLYIRLYRSGTDIGGWLERLLDAGSRALTPGSKIKVVHRSDRRFSSEAGRQFKTQQETIDNILDKISRSGYSSLTKEEKETLFKASKHKEN